MRKGFFSTLVLGLGFALSVDAWAAFRVGLVLDRGGRDDKSFNSAAYQGVTEAKEKLGIELRYVEAGDDNQFEARLRDFAKKDFDLIIAVGITQAEALSKVAPQFPTKKFAIVDAEVKGDNVRSLLFEEHEGSFLVGAIAGMKSKTGVVGFVGGMDIPLIRRFQMGYEAGAKHTRPDAKILSGYVGVTGEAWNNPAKGKEIAMSQYAGGADIIFAPAGASNLGVFDAAEEKKLFAIGVDSNQNWIKPGRIVTSMLKRVDRAVYAACDDAKAGKFSGGTVRFGLANAGVDFAVDAFNKDLLLPADVAKVQALKQDILAKKIVVPDFYLQPKKKN
ncbi:MAG: BMP family ABC transporter substrate-binding protein [Bdellovibrionota bacterium]